MPLGDKNRATVRIEVQPLGETASQCAVTCRSQVTRDGVLWFNAPEFEMRAVAAGTSEQTGRVDGALLRFEVTAATGDRLRDDVRCALHVTLERV